MTEHLWSRAKKPARWRRAREVLRCRECGAYKVCWVLRDGTGFLWRLYDAGGEAIGVSWSERIASTPTPRVALAERSEEAWL